MFRKRHGRTRRYRTNPVAGLLGSPMAAFKDFISRDTLTIAGGAVLGTLATNYVVSAFGPAKADGTAKAATDFVLPGLRPDATTGKVSPVAVIAYSAGIPLGASILARKFSPGLAKGLMIGGAISLMQNIMVLIKQQQQSATAPVGAYLRSGTIRALPGSAPGYSAVRAFGGALDNSTAFKGAWSR